VKTKQQLDAALDMIRASPRDHGRLELLVRRPSSGAREVLSEGTLDLTLGLVGDNWSSRPSSRLKTGGPHPDMQLNVINARVSAAIASTTEARALAGDQLHVDLDLSIENLPPGTRLAIGSSIIEVTPEPHTGCKKFSERFGVDALAWVSTPLAKELRLRGLSARVIQGGPIRPGDVIRKLATNEPAVSAPWSTRA
jgi:MOSC domain-containing protein YiiM